MRPISAGMWAVDEKGRAGIVFRVGPYDGARGGQQLEAHQAELHLVDERGETQLVVVRAIAGLVQARLREIPEPRRPSKKLAARLGYAV